MTYSLGFKERMVEKMLGPDGSSAHMLSKETGVAKSTLLRWRENAIQRGDVNENSSGKQRKRRRAHPPKEKIRLVMGAAGLSEEELGAFLRREGLHEADLKRMRAEVLDAAERGLAPPKRQQKSPAEQELKRVKKELARKEKALAETAALLVLRGKLEAFLSEDEDDDTPEKKG